jgi:serine phosphatase RsbU (regulator of sigma subunit)
MPECHGEHMLLQSSQNLLRLCKGKTELL